MSNWKPQNQRDMDATIRKAQVIVVITVMVIAIAYCLCQLLIRPMVPANVNAANLRGACKHQAMAGLK